MHKAQAFFYVAAGVFLLALSYHLGARSAGAQAGNPVCAGTAVLDGRQNWAVTSNGTVYEQTGNDAGPGVWYSIRTIPVASRPVALSVFQPASGADPTFLLLTEDGTAYHWVTWHGDYTTSSVFGGPTPARQSTWGRVKSRYRGERGAAQPTTQDR